MGWDKLQRADISHCINKNVSMRCENTGNAFDDCVLGKLDADCRRRSRTAVANTL